MANAFTTLKWRKANDESLIVQLPINNYLNTKTNKYPISE